MDYLRPYQKYLNWEELCIVDEKMNRLYENPAYQELLNSFKNLPEPKKCDTDFSGAEITLGTVEDLTPEQHEVLDKILKQHIPWKKGPFNFFGTLVDAEWRSDQKWERLKCAIGSLEGKVIMDIGCNNGYFMFRMAEQNPKLVLGIDPVVPCALQFDLVNHYAKQENLHFELWGVEHLVNFKEMFDTIFHMGIIYHHRHPIAQLIDIRNALKPGGQAIIETIGIPGSESVALFPEDKYAGMKNVWFVPTLPCLINWCKRARFIDVELISDTPLTNCEQRNTEWSGDFRQSLDQVLDPSDHHKTIEGHPAPRRFCLSVKKKGLK